jgi:hypothetical protein
MSRIGKKPIPVPKGVTVTLDGNVIRVKGPKGELERTLHPAITAAQEDGTVVVGRPSDEAEHRALHGLSRTLGNPYEYLPTAREVDDVGVILSTYVERIPYSAAPDNWIFLRDTFLEISDQ